MERDHHGLSSESSRIEAHPWMPSHPPVQNFFTPSEEEGFESGTPFFELIQPNTDDIPLPLAPQQLWLQQEFQASREISYRVQYGDSLQKIAQQFGVSVESIKSSNQEQLRYFQGRKGKVAGFMAGETITIVREVADQGPLLPSDSFLDNGQELNWDDSPGSLDSDQIQDSPKPRYHRNAGRIQDGKLTLSPGIIQMTSEGSFAGRYDVRKPHFPENLGLFKKISLSERFSGTRYQINSFGRAKPGTGEYQLLRRLKGKYNPGTYRNYGSGFCLGTFPNNSGVTIGFGVDLGARYTDQESALNDLTEAGIEVNKSRLLVQAVGKRGLEAAKLAAELRDKVQITAAQAINLLAVVSGDYARNFESAKVHPALEQLFISINYWRGSASATGKKVIGEMMQAAQKVEGIEQFREALRILEPYRGPGIKVAEKSYTQKSFHLRCRYLETIIAHLEAGEEVVIANEMASMEDLLSGSNDSLDFISEVAEGTHVEGKDLLEDLTGEKKRVNPLLSGSVGLEGENQSQDVLLVQHLLNAAGFPTLINSRCDAQLIESIKAFQAEYFKWKPDGLVSPGKNTIKSLSKFKSKIGSGQGELKMMEIIGLYRLYIDYKNDKIKMPEFARSCKPYAASHGNELMYMTLQLATHTTDNFAYALVKASSDEELKSFNPRLLKLLVHYLGSWLTLNRGANLDQKTRIEKALGLSSEVNTELTPRQDRTLADLATEAVDNEKDQRKYRQGSSAKDQGTGVDCSYFVREVVATYESEEARKLKQEKGFLTTAEIQQYSRFFGKDHFNEFEGGGAVRLAKICRAYGSLSKNIESIEIGDIVFFGAKIRDDLSMISHVGIVHEISTENGHKSFHFTDSGNSGAKRNPSTGRFQGGGRSVRNRFAMNHQGSIWDGDMWFIRVGKLSKL